MPKQIIGLTGGIAAGKSAISKLLASLGVAVIDADQLARDVVLPGSYGLQAVVDRFGVEFLTPMGELDRPKMGRLIFGDVQPRLDLNAILHPLILALYRSRLQEALASEAPYVVFDAALIVELGMQEEFNRLIVVATDPELQIKRLMKRNRLTEDEARQRLAAQAPLGVRVAAADFVILNDNDRDALEQRTRAVHAQILAMVSAGCHEPF